MHHGICRDICTVLTMLGIDGLSYDLLNCTCLAVFGGKKFHHRDVGINICHGTCDTAGGSRHFARPRRIDRNSKPRQNDVQRDPNHNWQGHHRRQGSQQYCSPTKGNHDAWHHLHHYHHGPLNSARDLPNPAGNLTGKHVFEESNILAFDSFVGLPTHRCR